jgi:hypothetical protein
VHKIISAYFTMKITQFATAITTITNPPFVVIESASSSSNMPDSSTKSAASVASTLSLQAAIAKMTKLLNGNKLLNASSTAAEEPVAVTSYKVTGSPMSIWSGVSISGTNVIACVNDYTTPANNLIYYSSDGGKSWSQTSVPTYQWSSVSLFGSYALASNLSNQSANTLFYSTNAGQTWTSNNEVAPIINVTTSGTSSQTSTTSIKAITQSKQIYYATSNGSSINWTLSSTTIPHYPTAVSNSGSNAVLCEGTGSIYYSSDSGATWNISNSPFTDWLSVSISGKYAVACDKLSKTTYCSSDYGATWTKSTTTLATSACCVSISGANAVVGSNGNYIYYSSNYGQTWTLSTWIPTSTYPTIPNWAWWRISIDATLAVSCVYGGYIYYSSDSGVTWNQS